MITIIATLLFAAFLQGALLPFSLTFMILICRTFVTYERVNYSLAFWFGLLVALLLGLPLGSLSLFYLLCLVLISFIRRTQFASSWVAMLPLAVFLLALNQVTVGVLSGSGMANLLRWQSLLPEVIFILPVYFSVRFWEERFIPRKEIRLKMGK